MDTDSTEGRPRKYVRMELRKLVTDIVIPDYDYVNTRYSFQTVFYLTDNHYSYCLCPCTFEHELVMYISDTKAINEVMFTRVADNIEAGRCPHVDNVPEKYLKETEIYGLHIASAVGSMPEQVFGNDLLNINIITMRSALLAMNPLQVAVGKQSYRFMSAYRNLAKYTNVNLGVYLEAEKLTYSDSKMRVKLYRCLQACVTDGTLERLNGLLNTGLQHQPISFAKALGVAMKRNSEEILDSLISYIRNCVSNANYQARSCLELCVRYAIVYNRADIVEKLLKDNKDTATWQKHFFLRIAGLFNRAECQDIIRSNQQSNSFPASLPADYDSKLLDVLDLLLSFYEEFRSDVMSMLKRFLSQDRPGSNENKCKTRRSFLLLLFKSIGVRLNLLPLGTYHTMINDIINLDVDINYKDSEDNSAVTYILEHPPMPHLVFREILETLIYQNPEIQIYSTVVSLALQMDKRNDLSDSNYLIPGTYITDGKLHALFEDSGSLNWALNFTAPLLIECGFPINRKDIQAFVASQQSLTVPEQVLCLHPSVREYLDHYLDCPQRLTKTCRDTLRKHFSARQIHKYVEIVNVPKLIREFILLKPVLRCIFSKEDMN